MERIYIRDGEELTCDVRPSTTGLGFELILTQDGEDHVEHFPLESQARARSATIEDYLIHDGWLIASEQRSA
jgi:hypothetical protein